MNDGVESLQALLPRFGLTRKPRKTWRVQRYNTSVRVSPCFTSEGEAVGWLKRNYKTLEHGFYAVANKAKRHYTVLTKYYEVDAVAMLETDWKGEPK